MKGASQVIIGATLVMAASLAIVLGLVLVLLAELYCSLLLRRRRSLCNPDTSATPAAVSATPATTASPASNPLQPYGYDRPATSPLSSFYSQGVLHAPRSLLFPAISHPEDDRAETKKHHHQLQHHFAQEQNSSFVSVIVPQHQEYDSVHSNKHLMYISNPIYDNDSGRPVQPNTPFETPDSSPSRLEAGGSSPSQPSSGDEEERREELPTTPPLTPMKKLPAEACSVPLRDVRSLCTSCSDTNTNLGLLSSSSGTPCTSPSW